MRSRAMPQKGSPFPALDLAGAIIFLVDLSRNLPAQPREAAILIWGRPPGLRPAFVPALAPFTHRPLSSRALHPIQKFLSLISGARQRLAALLLCALPLSPAQGQGWELGAGAGYGFYRNGRVFAPAGIAAAGVRSRFTLTAWLAENHSRRLAGELRYTYQDGDPFLESQGLRTNVQGQSHALHFALRFPLRAANAGLRPYLTTGFGAKRYEVTGPEALNPPLTEIARLRAAGEWRALVVAGIGVDWVLRPSVSLRAEFLDYVTPFPKQVIEPVPYASARGFLHQLTPSLSLCWRIR